MDAVRAITLTLSGLVILMSLYLIWRINDEIDLVEEKIAALKRLNKETK